MNLKGFQKVPFSFPLDLLASPWLKIASWQSLFFAFTQSTANHSYKWPPNWFWPPLCFLNLLRGCVMKKNDDCHWMNPIFFVFVSVYTYVALIPFFLQVSQFSFFLEVQLQFLGWVSFAKCGLSSLWASSSAAQTGAETSSQTLGLYFLKIEILVPWIQPLDTCTPLWKGSPHKGHKPHMTNEF